MAVQVLQQPYMHAFLSTHEPVKLLVHGDSCMNPSAIASARAGANDHLGRGGWVLPGCNATGMDHSNALERSAHAHFVQPAQEGHVHV